MTRLRRAGQRLEQRGAAARQPAKKRPERGGRIAFQPGDIVHAGEARQFRLEMMHRAQRGVVRVEKTKGALQQSSIDDKLSKMQQAEKLEREVRECCQRFLFTTCF